ncbi:MAG: helix-turn-helix domain-containing protein [Halioglobus sp.]|nr:helix-turn-helix domain-containing protein [Halioglobus sp.]
MSEAALRQFDAFSTPGSLLRAAREAQGMSEREAADRLNLMPDYVGFLERDEYQSLRSPPFARGYVKSYGRLLGLDEQQLLALFDEQWAGRRSPVSRGFTGAARATAAHRRRRGCESGGSALAGPGALVVAGGDAGERRRGRGRFRQSGGHGVVFRSGR